MHWPVWWLYISHISQWRFNSKRATASEWSPLLIELSLTAPIHLFIQSKCLCIWEQQREREWQQRAKIHVLCKADWEREIFRELHESVCIRNVFYLWAEERDKDSIVDRHPETYKFSTSPASVCLSALCEPKSFSKSSIFVYYRVFVSPYFWKSTSFEEADGVKLGKRIASKKSSPLHDLTSEVVQLASSLTQLHIQWLHLQLQSVDNTPPERAHGHHQENANR